MPQRTSSTIFSPVGTPFQLSPFTNDDHPNQSFTALPDGGFVMTWVDRGGNTEVASFQIFGADGTPIGDPYELASTRFDRDGEVQYPEVVVLDTGDLAVFWEVGDSLTAERGTVRLFDALGTPISDEITFGQSISVVSLPGGGFAVMAEESDFYDGWVSLRVFDGNGVPTGNAVQINIGPHDTEYTGSLTRLDDGGFVAVWMQQKPATPTSPYSYDVFARTFDASGTPVSDETRVNTVLTNHQYKAEVSALDGGGYVITWLSKGETTPQGTEWTVNGQVFDSTGNKVGTEFVIGETFDTGWDVHNVKALPTGGFVVTWTDYSTDGNGDIAARIYDASGQPLGEVLRPAEVSEEAQDAPDVTVFDSGKIAIVWTSFEIENTVNADVYIQILDETGNLIGENTIVHAETDRLQIFSAITELDNGDFMVRWHDYDLYGNGRNDGTFGQIFSVNAVSTGAPVIQGGAGTGSPLAVDTSTIDDADGLGLFTYQWHRDGEDLTGQTRTRYVVTEEDLGSRLSVTVTYTDGNGTVETITSDPTDPVTLFRIKGDNDPNILYGSDDVNVIYGYGGADELHGLGEDDTLIGGTRDDILFGHAGNDILRGDLNDDTIDGGSGTDRIVGGRGNDTLTGGADADAFMFRRPDFGDDVITDFEIGVDALRLSHPVDSSTDITQTQDGHALLTLADGTITFQGLSVADLVGHFDGL